MLRVVRVLAGLPLLHAMDQHLVREHRERASLWFLGPTLLVDLERRCLCNLGARARPESGTEDFGDALYWSAITITTIGYGDVAPATPQGRVVAGLLAFIGIGLFGLLSAQITARLVRQPDTATEELRSLRHEMSQIRQLLERRDVAARGHAPEAN